MPLTLNPPPPTPVEPVTEMLHGIPVTDPYRWLEDQNFPRTRLWLIKPAAYARPGLRAITGCDRIRICIEELVAADVTSEPWKLDARHFYLNRACQSQRRPPASIQTLNGSMSTGERPRNGCSRRPVPSSLFERKIPCVISYSAGVFEADSF